jgi:pseudouridine-5'-phosphate glycosidase
VVIANAVPLDAQIDPQLHERALAGGLAAAAEQRITGKAVTPFLLDYFRGATGGASLGVNRRIVLDNARVAARIAVALAGRRSSL